MIVLPSVPPGLANRLTKPSRVFIASTPELPPTTMALYEEGIVLVKHPLKPEKTLTFSDVDSAKRWLQTLTILSRP